MAGLDSKNIIARLTYAIKLSKATNKELMEECFEAVYGQVKFNRRGMVIEEMMDRIDNEDDVMKRELKRGIL